MASILEDTTLTAIFLRRLFLRQSQWSQHVVSLGAQGHRTAYWISQTLTCFDCTMANIAYSLWGWQHSIRCSAWVWWTPNISAFICVWFKCVLSLQIVFSDFSVMVFAEGSNFLIQSLSLFLRTVVLSLCSVNFTAASLFFLPPRRDRMVIIAWDSIFLFSGRLVSNKIPIV